MFLLFTPCLCVGGVLFRDAQVKGKVPVGFEKFLSNFPYGIEVSGARLWEESVFESSTGFLPDNLQDVCFCGLLCLKHPSTSCCIPQHSPAGLGSTLLLYHFKM